MSVTISTTIGILHTLFLLIPAFLNIEEKDIITNEKSFQTWKTAKMTPAGSTKATHSCSKQLKHLMQN